MSGVYCVHNVRNFILILHLQSILHIYFTLRQVMSSYLDFRKAHTEMGADPNIY
jgi:hypothetical protein